MKLLSVVGARPNFMKIAPLCRAIDHYNNKKNNPEPGTKNQELRTRNPEPKTQTPLLTHTLVHTGQHYDKSMSSSFFDDLDIPLPDVNLEVAKGTSVSQIGRIMVAFEEVLEEVKPDCVIVVGDVNATAACAMATKHHRIPLAHIESGLRSFDLNMPEEINRMVTDRLADILFTTSQFADDNLRAEGVSPERIQRVGNVMIDTLENCREKSERITLESITNDKSIGNGEFHLMTLHRPSNVDEKETLRNLMETIQGLPTSSPFVFPVHPRTRARFSEFGLDYMLDNERIIPLEPVGYLQMLKLIMSAKTVLTDSGGLQEECSVLGTPCLTLRTSTERPITLVENSGTNLLVGVKPQNIKQAFQHALEMPHDPRRPELWDGHAAERILEHLLQYLTNE